MQLLEYVVAGLALLGAFLNARKLRGGFYVWFVANITGAGFFYYKQLYGMGGLYLVFACLNVYGIRQWRKEAV